MNPALNSCPLLESSVWQMSTVTRLFFRHVTVAAKYPSRLIGTLGICLIGLSSIYISDAADAPGFETSRKTIALHGGTEFSLRILPREDANGAKMPITEGQVDQVMTVIQKRLKTLGTRDAQVTPKGDNGIIVQVPAATPEESKSIRKTLEVVGKLSLHYVNPRNHEVGPDGKTLPERVAANEEIVLGYKVLTYKHKDEDGSETAIPILLNRRAALGSNDIALATPYPRYPGTIAIKLNKAGTDKMISWTKDIVSRKDRIAIVIDGVLISAPIYHHPLRDNFLIEGLGAPGELNCLIAALMNPYEMPVVIEAERSVSPPKDPK